MPYGVRSSLVAALLCTGFAAHAAGGSTWTDPPARQPEAVKPAPQAAAPATPAAVSPPVRKEARVKRRKEEAPRKVAIRHPHIRVARAAPPRVVSPRGPRIVAMAPRRMAPRQTLYRTYSEAGFPPSYEDQRLDRLSTAVGSGYLVMRRRTLEYPDGGVIRFYRPVEDDGME